MIKYTKLWQIHKSKIIIDSAFIGRWLRWLWLQRAYILSLCSATLFGPLGKWTEIRLVRYYERGNEPYDSRKPVLGTCAYRSWGSVTSLTLLRESLGVSITYFEDQCLSRWEIWQRCISVKYHPHFQAPLFRKEWYQSKPWSTLQTGMPTVAARHLK